MLWVLIRSALLRRRPVGMVGEACLPSNAYYPRTPDYTLYSGFHVCWSGHSNSSFIYGFMRLIHKKIRAVSVIVQSS